MRPQGTDCSGIHSTGTCSHGGYSAIPEENQIFSLYLPRELLQALYCWAGACYAQGVEPLQVDRNNLEKLFPSAMQQQSHTCTLRSGNSHMFLQGLPLQQFLKRKLPSHSTHLSVF